MCAEHPEATQYAAATPELEQAAKLPPPKIIGVIAQVSSFTDKTHYFVVVDREINLIYSRESYGVNENPYSQRHAGWYFIGKDGPFYDFLAGTNGKGQAFAGREFSINLDDGTKFQCNGDVWSVGSKAGMDTVEVGVASQQELNECYVFFGRSVERRVLEEWLATNTPQTDYHAFDPKEPARKAYRAEQERLAREKAEKQAACVHDFKEVVEMEEQCDDEDRWEVEITFKRCKLCGLETEHEET